MKTIVLFFSTAVLCILISFSVFSRKEYYGIRLLTFENLESLADEESDGTEYSCTATTECFNLIGQSDGSVSCTGKVCSRGWSWGGSRWVECDGNRTYC